MIEEIVATTLYQKRLFDRKVREANRRAALGWRERFRDLIGDAAAAYPPRDDIALDDLADMVNAVIEGGIVLARALEQPCVTANQVMLLRSYVKLLFSPAQH